MTELFLTPLRKNGVVVSDLSNAIGSVVSRVRVLIIKAGYSETFDPDTSGIVSLGDIVRSTIILSLLPPVRYHVSWVVDESGAALLDQVSEIDQLIRVTSATLDQITRGTYDIVINLEKSPKICRLAEKIQARVHIGFRYCDINDRIDTFHDADHVLSMTTDREFKRQQKKSWSELLFEMLGAVYTDAPYLMTPPSGEADLYDFGLNWQVGKKFPLKGWPKELWDQLDVSLSKDHRVCWQQSTNDLHGYINWINACRVLITNDSLGLHLALGLGKKVVSMFGPTSMVEIHDHPNIIKLQPDVDWSCIPCLESRCSRDDICMAHISLERVRDAALALLNGSA
ncbi:MAG: hypothetical protein HQL35_01430 [Alphaproteobacteria bacterium]|nr:hypothetical protein [Alphaproteobacteria bacterium]